MRRLVYAPKAHVFIKDQENVIHNLTAYTTAGQVTRRIDQLSSADVTLRNPNKIFTAHAGPNGVVRPLFSPMDPITIFLERRKGHHVRVFTGFLDKTPYLQLYPGTIQIKASCTLKRLLYTYFDPALPYTQTFLSTYGWMPLGTGSAVSTDAYNEFLQLDKLDPLAAPQVKSKKDGSLANLLYATLKHIGHWNTNDVYVEALPEHLFDRIISLADDFAKDNEDVQDKFKQLLKDLAGSSSIGSFDPANPATATGDLKDPEKWVPIVIQTADKYNIPAEMVLAVMGVETDFTGNDDPGNKYKGWFQMDVGGTGVGSYLDGPWRYNNPGGHPTLEESHDLGLATDAFCAAAAGRVRREPGLKSNLLEWAMKVQGVNGSNNPRYPQTWDSYIAKAKEYINRYGTNDLSGTDLPGDVPTDSTTRSTTKGGSTKSGSGDQPEGLATLAIEVAGSAVAASGGGAYGASRSYGTHAGVDISMPAGTKLRALCKAKVANVSSSWYSSSNGQGQGSITLQSLEKVGPYPVGTMFGYGHEDTIYKKVGDEVKAGDVIALSGNPGGGPHLHFWINTAGEAGTNGNTNPTELAKSLLDGKRLPANADNGPTDGGTGSPSAADSSAAGNASALGAMFFGQIEWPSMMEMTEAALLGGEKSLMNDKPLLPFIQQLCNASLRSFQSLPDGRFYAFFPDYFGEYNFHPPYWEIDDIEVLDGGVDLSDDSLVTHMYVVGDTVNPTQGGSPFLLRAMNSSGVVTIFNMFMASSVLNRADQREKNKTEAERTAKKNDDPVDPAGLGILLDRDEVVAFLQRYGVRPLVEDMPFIRSPYYEMFLAFQKFLLAWSRQFATPFTFTFMPELFPGGKVGFPNHGLQMYIEEASHSWDYESGFTTTATLSAPSVYRTGDNDAAVALLPPNMANAMIEPAKTKDANGS